MCVCLREIESETENVYERGRESHVWVVSDREREREREREKVRTRDCFRDLKCASFWQRERERESDCARERGERKMSLKLRKCMCMSLRKYESALYGERKGK